ncbi:hypothetical protein LKK83_27680 [Phormidium sp. CCY1219]|nr:hypothetical protein [Phormidium sp. CCY1219]
MNPAGVSAPPSAPKNRAIAPTTTLPTCTPCTVSMSYNGKRSSRSPQTFQPLGWCVTPGGKGAIFLPIGEGGDAPYAG